MIRIQQLVNHQHQLLKLLSLLELQRKLILYFQYREELLFHLLKLWCFLFLYHLILSFFQRPVNILFVLFIFRINFSHEIPHPGPLPESLYFPLMRRILLSRYRRGGAEKKKKKRYFFRILFHGEKQQNVYGLRASVYLGSVRSPSPLAHLHRT